MFRGDTKSLRLIKSSAFITEQEEAGNLKRSLSCFFNAQNRRGYVLFSQKLCCTELVLFLAYCCQRQWYTIAKTPRITGKKLYTDTALPEKMGFLSSLLIIYSK